MRRRLQFAILLLSALMASSASAQVFKIDGGKSTLFDATGGTVNIKGPNYETSVGMGMFQGNFQYGAVVHTRVMGYTVTAGDDSVRFDLPTDVFESTSYFSSRGFGVSKTFEDSKFYVFGGLTSRWQGSGYFRAAQSEEPVGVVFFEHRITDNIKFFSRDIFSSKNTALQGLEWTPEKWLKTSVTAGIGSGKPYFATAATAEWQKWLLKGSYVGVSPNFRRIIVPDISNAEMERENFEATYHFNRDASITATHRNLLQPLTLDGDLSRASMNQVSGRFRVGQTYFGTGLFNSKFSGQTAWGSNLYLGQRFGQIFDVSGNYFASKSGSQKLDSMITGTVRETLSPRVNLLQIANYSNGQWSGAYGGEFVTNRFNVRLDYQTVYLPFRVQKPFQQAISFNSSVRVMGPLAINAASSVAPDGRVRYSFGFTTYLYRYGGLMPSFGKSDETFKFPKFVVQGLVKDEQGQPVPGAAIQIGHEVVYTDGDGRFMLRVKRDKPMPFAVIPGQFITAGIYEIVSNPDSVTPTKPEEAQDIQVVVRRLTKEQAALRGLLASLKSPAPE